MACEIKNIHVVTIHSAFGGTLCIGCTILFLKCNNISFVNTGNVYRPIIGNNFVTLYPGIYTYNQGSFLVRS